jgi:diguanylate cyclase (GGDEF)-like protein/PAS domain S-box-containing protein
MGTGAGAQDAGRLIEAMPDAAVIVDASGAVAAANDAAKALAAAADEAALIGRPVADLLTAEGSPCLRRSGGDLLEVELSVTHLDDGCRLILIRDVHQERRTASQLADAERIAGIGVWEWHVPTDTVIWSREAYRLFDKPVSCQPTFELWLDSIHPDDRDPTAARVKAAFEEGSDYDFEHRVLRDDGSVRHLHCRGQVVFNDEGEVVRLVGVSQDVTERVLHQQALAEATARQQAVLGAAGEGICGLDAFGRVSFANPAAAILLGGTADELVGQHLGSRLRDPATGDEDPIATAIVHGERIADGRALARRDNGEEFPISFHCAPILSEGEPVGAVITFADARERALYEERLRYLAEHDALTGLLNRNRFEEEVAAQSLYAQRYGGAFSVLVLDLDHFKDVNDTRGHGPGDELIRTTARRLESALAGEGALARLGGDEFAILLPAAERPRAFEVAERLRTAISDHLMLAGGERLQVTASVGIAVCSEAAPDAEALISNADVAMYEAKESGRNRVIEYRPELGARTRMEERLNWSTQLRGALEEDGFELFAQPILALGDGPAERRFEVLLRLPQPDGSLATPRSFLPVAERHGLIREIDRWVVAQAIRIAARHAADETPLRLEINLSGQSMVDPDLPSFIDELLRAGGASPSQLIFEVTETTAIDSLGEARGLAQSLVELGCEFAIDDFGAGFGSFAYLKHLPSQYVKIDGDFIRRLPVSPDDQLVVAAIAGIARGMGKRTIAEFVESEEVLRKLADFGIDFAQGFHVGRPEPIAEAIAATAGASASA